MESVLLDQFGIIFSHGRVVVTKPKGNGELVGQLQSLMELLEQVLCAPNYLNAIAFAEADSTGIEVEAALGWELLGRPIAA
jgi:hypothetical protein